MVPRFLRPTFPDVGRVVIQTPALNALAAGHAMAGRILNAGCGEGGYCSWIESLPGVTRIDDVDIAISAEFSTSHPDPRHHLQIGSLTSLPYADASFDAALCTEVLEHIPDDAKAAAELARVLKPGGVLIASVPLLPAPFDPNHVRQGYTLESFRALLTGAGFVVEAHRTCCHAAMRAVMRYWRAPLVRVGSNRTPYIPSAVMSLVAHADRVLRIGMPWDVIVRASRR
jgi:SAM-dependent methyltransferase